MAKTIASQTSDKRYFLTIDGDHATDCTCPDRQYRHHTCKHMAAFNIEVNRAATFQLLKLRFDSRLNGDEQSRRCYYEMSMGL